MGPTGSEKLYVGRPWRMDELRIKSNGDLHKLWYVLLKERNQLMSMSEWYSSQNLHAPAPERMEKVEESMENLLEVIKERDEAYKFLEDGHSGRPEPYESRNVVGIPFMRTPTEHRVPLRKNTHFKRMHPKLQPWMKNYLALWDEKMRKSKHGFDTRQRHLAGELKEEFPHLTNEDLKVLKPWEKDIE